MHLDEDDMHSPPQKRSKMSDQKQSVSSTVTRAGDWSMVPVNTQRSHRDRRDDIDDDDDRSQRPGDRQKFTEGNFERYVILGTAIIRLQFGTFISPPFRAICDTGAQAGLITLAGAKASALPLKQCSKQMNGIGGAISFEKKIQAYILPWFNSTFRLSTEFFVSNEFGGTQPWINLNVLRPQTSLTLADTHFDVPAPVDILLAADVWSDIVGSILYRHVSGAVMHETALGYVILGRTWVPKEAFGTSAYQAMTGQAVEEQCEEKTLDKLLKIFFEDEDLLQKRRPLKKHTKRICTVNRMVDL